MIEILKDHFYKVSEITRTVDFNTINDILSLIIEARKKNKTIFVFGNGGSAATALHMTTDFSKTVEITGIPMKVISLNANQSEITAIANDYGYEKVFSKQLENLISNEDLVIGISASGNSPNCIEAFNVARSLGAKTIGVLGFDGGVMKKLSDKCFHIEINDYFYVEDIHMIFSHSLTRAIRNL